MTELQKTLGQAVQNIINADLHCHSVVSDGTLTPEALAERAAKNGVELWALTDHDEIGGQHRAAAAAKANGLKYVTGTEISVTFIGTTVHIVGLGFDPDNAGMQAGLRQTRGGRRERAQEISDGLAQVGIKGAYEGALKYVAQKLLKLVHFAGRENVFHGQEPVIERLVSRQAAERSG